MCERGERLSLATDVKARCFRVAFDSAVVEASVCVPPNGLAAWLEYRLDLALGKKILRQRVSYMTSNGTEIAKVDLLMHSRSRYDTAVSMDDHGIRICNSSSTSL